MLRIAVLGCGRIGKMHAHNIACHPRAELVAVFDVNKSAAQSVAKAYSTVVADSDTAVFSNDNIDAVLIASATETHSDYIEKAVAAGKPALCEKPIDLNLERVKSCAAKIAGRNVPIQLGFNRRFDPGHKAARNAMQSGEIGDLHQIIITSRDPSLPPRSYLEEAGGLLRDMTIHDFDLARFMLDGDPVESVFAIASAMINPALGAELNEVDTAMIIMRSVGGIQVHINNSRTAVYGYDQRVELMGSAGMVLSDNRKPHECRKYSASIVEAAEPYQHFFIERYTESYIAEVDAFIDTVENGAPMIAEFDDGQQALILAEAAYLSLREGRMVYVNEI